jgi:hypothetical protein
MGKILVKGFSNQSEDKKAWNLTDNRFVCILDIMGFKDMVIRNSHDSIYEMLNDLSKYRSDLENPNVPDGYDPNSIKTVSFSDTIAIFTKTLDPKCFELLTYCVGWLFAKAMQDGIAMKGAISCGKMSINISRQIFFGQPLIDAHLLHEETAYYGIVIHDSVERYINSTATQLKPHVIERYIDCPVPLKSGIISHLILDWADWLMDSIPTKKEKIKLALEVLKKQRERTSGPPRKYIDNTLKVITHICN